MGVLGTTRLPPEHSGVVHFSFYDAEDNTVYSNRVFTRRDAASVYDGLRIKYPEHEDLRLRVTVLGASELSIMEQRGVIAKGVSKQPAMTPPGEPFCSKVDGIGPRDERLKVLNAFFQPRPWEPARPLSEVLG